MLFHPLLIQLLLLSITLLVSIAVCVQRHFLYISMYIPYVYIHIFVFFFFILFKPEAGKRNVEKYEKLISVDGHKTFKLDEGKWRLWLMYVRLANKPEITMRQSCDHSH